jgi:hypothetical protein
VKKTERGFSKKTSDGENNQDSVGMATLLFPQLSTIHLRIRILLLAHGCLAGDKSLPQGLF